METCDKGSLAVCAQGWRHLGEEPVQVEQVVELEHLHKVCIHGKDLSKGHTAVVGVRACQMQESVGGWVMCSVPRSRIADRRRPESTIAGAGQGAFCGGPSGASDGACLRFIFLS